MAIANVALNNTFDQWRIITNQLVVSVNEVESNANLVRAYSNSLPITMTKGVSRGGTIYLDLKYTSDRGNTSNDFLASANLVNLNFQTLGSNLSNATASVNANLSVATVSANVYAQTYANIVGVAVNTNLSRGVASANAYAQTYANLVGVASNTNLSIAVASVNTNLSVGVTSANVYAQTYANIVGVAVNTNLSIATVSANVYAQTYANLVGIAVNTNHSIGHASANAYAQTYANLVGIAVNTNLSIAVASANAYAQTYANLVGIAVNTNLSRGVTSANAYAQTYANLVGIAVNTNLSIAVASVNTNLSVGVTSANVYAQTYANLVGIASNTNLSIATASVNTNLSIGVASANAYATTYANNVGNSCNNIANARFLANVSNVNTIGDFFVNGNLTITASLVAANINIAGPTTIASANALSIGVSEVNSFSYYAAAFGDQIVDYWPTTTYRSANYLISITCNSDYTMTQVNIIHNGTDAFITEYGTVQGTANNLGTFNAGILSGAVRLNVITSLSNTTLKIFRTAIYP